MWLGQRRDTAMVGLSAFACGFLLPIGGRYRFRFRFRNTGNDLIDRDIVLQIEPQMDTDRKWGKSV